MFEKREIIDFLQDAFSAMEKVEGFVSDMTYEEFINDEKTVFAVPSLLSSVRSFQMSHGEISLVCGTY
jgi:uncharacterized protein with HEPN domain